MRPPRPDATAQAEANATVAAGATALAGTAQARLESAATSIVDLSVNLGTATAQVNALVFAFNSAAEDRATAVSGLLAAQTQVSALDAELATAQVAAGQRPSATPPPPASATPVQAATLAPTATPEPATSADVELTQNFTTEAGVRFRLPEGWNAQEGRNNIFISSNERAADPQAEYQAGDYVVILFIINGEQLTGQKDLALADMAQIVVQAFSGGDNPLTFGPVRESQVGDLPVAEARTNNDPINTTMLVASYGNDQFVAVLADSLRNEADVLSDIVRQILATFVF